MSTQSKTEVVKDFAAKTIVINREFKAPIATVWRAFTEPAILDQWWGPQPWRAETKDMDFRVGGHWLYAMVGPENEKHWARMDYTAIEKEKSFSADDVFCDENGNVNTEFPVAKGRNSFTPSANGTMVTWYAEYATEADLQKIVEMGFEQGITICFEQLDAIIQQNKI